MLILPLISATKPVGAEKKNISALSLSKVPSVSLSYIGSEKTALTRLATIVFTRLSPFIKKITGINDTEITDRISINIIRELFSRRSQLRRNDKLSEGTFGRIVKEQILSFPGKIPPPDEMPLLNKLYPNKQVYQQHKT